MNNQYNIYGLSRSGNHAIIFWIIHNLVDEVFDIGHNIYIDKNYKLCYINNVNMYDKYNEIKINFPTDIFKNVIKSYEDLYFNKTTSVIILRDFLNLLCSRYKKYQKNICFDTKYICDLLFLIEVWKQHTRGSRIAILYNKWLVSKDYRDNICKNLLKSNNVVDKIDYIPDIGGGSSFSGTNPVDDKTVYESRHRDITLPDYMIDHLIKDTELLELNEKFFNINIKKELMC